MHNIPRIGKVLSCALLVHFSVDCGISQAAPILLAELYHSQASPDTAGETFIFRFHTGTSFEDQVELSRTPTPADIGRTFPAEPATLAEFDRILTSGDHQIDSGFGTFQSPRQATANQFFDGSFMGEIPPVHSPENSRFIMNAYVPQLGPGFSGYRITVLEQVINGMSIEQRTPTTFLYWGAHTIRISGERIPEPKMSLLVAQGLICLTWRQKRTLTRFIWYMPDNQN
jgi:hypothetical protein